MIAHYKDVKINFHSSGKGKPIVFLHGFLANTSMWEETVTHISQEYHCITIDLLGHGNSENIGYIHTMEEMSHAVHSVCKKLAIKNPILVGHSMGGYVALAYLELYPKAVAGLALINSTASPDSKERKLNRDRAISIVKKNPTAYTSMAIANLFAQENRTTLKDAIENVKNQAASISLQGILSGLEGMKIRKDRHAILKDFENPKIMFAGIKDPILNYEDISQESKIANTKLITFDGGHMTYLENKTEYLNELLCFLQKV